MNIAAEPVNGSIKRFAVGKAPRMRLRQLYLFPAHFRIGLMLKFQSDFYAVKYRLIYWKRPVVALHSMLDMTFYTCYFIPSLAGSIRCGTGALFVHCISMRRL